MKERVLTTGRLLQRLIAALLQNLGDSTEKGLKKKGQYLCSTGRTDTAFPIIQPDCFFY